MSHRSGFTRLSKGANLKSYRTLCESMMLLAIASLAGTNATAAVGDADPAPQHAPIPVQFELPQAGMVSLVIERPDGTRVRNLVSETPFPAGKNSAWWDGLDDLGRDEQAASHGVYHIPGKLVDPGAYRVRGMVRPELGLTYEWSLYNRGNPPWTTKDRSSGWLTNHSPASAILFVPEAQAPRRGEKKTPGGQMLVGSFVAEGGSGLAWLDLDANKQHGQMWLGGVWTGVTRLAVDEGDNPVAGVYAYAGAPWQGDQYNGNQSELRLHMLVQPGEKGAAPKDQRFGTGEDPAILSPTYKYEKLSIAGGNGTPEAGAEGLLGGLAVRNGLLIASLPRHDRMVFIDVRAKKVVAEAKVAEPRGLAFDRAGRLLVISGRTLVRYEKLPDVTAPAEAGATKPTTQQAQLPQPQVLVASGLEDPRQLCLDSSGNIYVSDWGQSHQVKVYSPDGKLMRVIGRGGAPRLGTYDQTAMSHPNGISIDSRGRLWVAETDKAPKRLSLWGTADGKLITAYYGPPKYGGGGTIDPVDKTRAFYVDEDGSAIEFKVDWESGISAPAALYHRREEDAGKVLPSLYSAETPIHVGKQTYLTDCFSGNPTGGIQTAALWLMGDGTARRVAAVGQANAVPAFNRTSSFSARWKGKVVPQYSETYKFLLDGDDGTRLWVNGKCIIDNWRDNAGRAEGTIELKAGQASDITLEYFQRDGSARVQMAWSSPSQQQQVVPTERLYPLDAQDALAKGAPGSGLSAEYFAGASLTQLIDSRIDPKIAFDWGSAGLKLSQPNPFHANLPKGLDLGKDRVIFAWSDVSGDGQMQPDEVTFAAGETRGVVFMQDLSVVTATAIVLKPVKMTDAGVPIYDATKAVRVLGEGISQGATTSGGNQAILAKDGSLVMMNAPKPFSHQGPGGVSADGRVLWSYPSAWPGLHASHIAPLPDQPGMMLGTTRLIGYPVVPNADLGEVWAVNGNKGNIYLMTTDGLFVATLFKDCRTASWAFDTAERGMDVSSASLHEENFWPTITQTVADGAIYIQANGDSPVVKLHGLDQAKRIASTDLSVSKEQLEEARVYFQDREIERQQAANKGPSILAIARPATAPTVDGDLGEWKDAKWATIDQRITQLGDWGKRKVVTAGTMSISGDRLFIAIKTDDANLLQNSGDSLQNLFKTGGGIDLMLGAVPGGERLLVSRVKDKTTAVLYRARLPQGAKKEGEPVQFTSPLRTVTFDVVKDVSDQIVLASATVRDPATKVVTEATFELSVPLTVLEYSPVSGQSVPGDIGVLRGNGFRTLQRIYWNNKATGLVSDVPSEAELTPKLWGTFKVE